MQVLYSLILLLYSTGSITSHEIQVALYKISQDNHQITVEIVVEQAAIEKVLGKGSAELTEALIGSYLHDHFSLAINGCALDIKFDTYTNRVKHLIINGHSESLPTQIEEIEISNTCLLTLKGYSNVVEITLAGRQRDFLMNKNRQTIHVKYD